jgi:hypothetical protein
MLRYIQVCVEELSEIRINTFYENDGWSGQFAKYTSGEKDPKFYVLDNQDGRRIVFTNPKRVISN